MVRSLGSGSENQTLERKLFQERLKDQTSLMGV